jgi:hypothetical protein
MRAMDRFFGEWNWSQVAPGIDAFRDTSASMHVVTYFGEFSEA